MDDQVGDDIGQEDGVHGQDLGLEPRHRRSAAPEAEPQSQGRHRGQDGQASEDRQVGPALVEQVRDADEAVVEDRRNQEAADNRQVGRRDRLAGKRFVLVVSASHVSRSSAELTILAGRL